MKRYSKEEILFAGEIGEVSMIDVKHVVSLLDEAREKLKTKKLNEIRDYVKKSDFSNELQTIIEILEAKSVKQLKKIINKKLTTSSK